MKVYMKNFFLIITIHDQNIHPLATEIYKVANDLSVGDFKDFFDFKDQYALHIPLVNTELKGKNLITLRIEIFVWIYFCESLFLTFCMDLIS